MDPLTKEERLQLVARLDGYLDAAASVNGEFRDFVASAQLIPKNGYNVTQMLQHFVASWEPAHACKIVSLSDAHKWTAIESFLEQALLTCPFNEPSMARSLHVQERRFELAFQASDMVMFLSPNHKPTACYRAELVSKLVHTAQICVVEYESDYLVLTNIHWRTGHLGDQEAAT
ncbi:hypothetical protein [Chitinolyticbacter albus]|uniref:hypothetical protein n=1 Tax=Chitinolyticbacter albus TaxID=2961951 RepID=UPI00210DF743|nr:hypothetical protein [Chitinolyticbacter albus]